MPCSRLERFHHADWHPLCTVSFRWLGFRLEFLGNIVVLAAAMFAVVTPDLEGGLVGLSVSYAMQVSVCVSYAQVSVVVPTCVWCMGEFLSVRMYVVSVSVPICIIMVYGSLSVPMCIIMVNGCQYQYVCGVCVSTHVYVKYGCLSVPVSVPLCIWCVCMSLCQYRYIHSVFVSSQLNVMPTQKVPNKRLINLAQTHNMQIFREIPFVKPQNDT